MGGKMTLENILTTAPVLPVLVIEERAHAVPLARALVAGGLPVLEITLRTAVALDAVKAIAAEVPEAIVGVGTVTRPAQFDEAVTAGARFAVSPGLTPNLLAASRCCPIPLLPGVFSPGEAMVARDEGFLRLKLFPAEQAGGVGMLRALSGPLADLCFCPTGGIGAASFREYLALPNVICVGGSWVAPSEAVKAGDWIRITRLAAEAATTVKQRPNKAPAA
jgi:2-dehydro-3-deoxyphosphogluconate aldolase/(4S)-4-hydroxy-2-oxoglutarate aldolase